MFPAAALIFWLRSLFAGVGSAYDVWQPWRFGQFQNCSRFIATHLPFGNHGVLGSSKTIKVKSNELSALLRFCMLEKTPGLPASASRSALHRRRFPPQRRYVIDYTRCAQPTGLCCVYKLYILSIYTTFFEKCKITVSVKYVLYSLRQPLGDGLQEGFPRGGFLADFEEA